MPVNLGIHLKQNPDTLETIDRILAAFSSFMWGTPLVVLLVGGGLYFLIYSRFIPYRYFFHSINILRGKYDDPDDPGDISHFEALASVLIAQQSRPPASPFRPRA